jgi:hypothetical protein
MSGVIGFKEAHSHMIGHLIKGKEVDNQGKSIMLPWAHPQVKNSRSCNIKIGFHM